MERAGCQLCQRIAAQSQNDQNIGTEVPMNELADAVDNDCINCDILFTSVCDQIERYGDAHGTEWDTDHIDVRTTYNRFHISFFLKPCSERREVGQPLFMWDFYVTNGKHLTRTNNYLLPQQLRY
jgi:hypothetical protein